jgi:Tfp pilus tip-associated adhesin PilY1
VQAPSFSYSDTGYSSFKTANASRQGMVYVGANDGMLHAFRSDTGAESWAYIPSMLLPSLYKLADKNHASTHCKNITARTRCSDSTEVRRIIDKRWKEICCTYQCDIIG